jgi:enediyne biosynthesis protein E4
MRFIKYFLLFGCFLAGVFTVADEDSAPVSIETLPLTDTISCSGQFVAHDLDHITTVPGGKKVRMFEANGAGVGINDLDNDGDLDIVLANQADPNTILWNEGGLNFRTERLPHGDSRAVTIIDYDGDGLLDMVFSRTNRAPTSWHNDGNGHFTRQFLGGVGKPLYAMNWGDLDGDGDLDLVGATYDAGLLADFGQEFLNSGNAGVYYYESYEGQFRLHTLAVNAQALALALVDLNHDGKLDIWVGNDFGVPDQTWYWTQAGWERVYPLTSMTYSTMSLDFGDINNDGQNEIFSTDMKAYPGDTQGEEVLNSITESINETLPADDPQVTANVLQSIGSFSDMAEAAGVDATGWSWSGKFGDFDQDGFLDLYVVNGFKEVATLAQLPNQELVEDNQAFRNTGDGQFAPMPEWGLASARGGRGMSMADLDGDGDLDIVVNNLLGAAQLFENQICEGKSLQVDLFWLRSGNTRALGANLTLHTSTGTYYRDVKAASGYLSGDAARIHFGFPKDAQLQKLEIRWPDGVISTIDELTPHTLVEITRTD